jgi:hypothetical protein
MPLAATLPRPRQLLLLCGTARGARLPAAADGGRSICKTLVWHQRTVAMAMSAAVNRDASNAITRAAGRGAADGRMARERWNRDPRGGLCALANERGLRGWAPLLLLLLAFPRAARSPS